MRILCAALTTALAAAVVAVPAAAAAAPAHAAEPTGHQHSRRHEPRTAPSAPGTFVPVAQFRALDTRSAGGALAAGHALQVPIAGRRDVPADAAAVWVSVHAIAPTADGVLTVFPAGTKRPNTTDVVFERGHAASQAALSRLSGGALRVADRATSGRVQVAVDVLGYVAGAPHAAVNRSDAGLVHLLPAPARAFDTRPLGQILRAGDTRTVSVGHGVPSSGVGAVGVMLTAVDPTRRGALMAYAVGNDQPTAATTSFTGGHSTSAFAWVPTKGDGRITIANASAGATDVVLDVVAWTNAGVAQVAGAVQPRFPDELINERPVAARHTLTVPLAGRGGVPISGVRAVLVSVGVAGASGPGALVAWRDGAVPHTSALEFTAGRPAESLVALPLANGAIHLRNVSAQPVLVSLSVSGFVPSVRHVPPPTSVSRYLGDLTQNVDQDTAMMAQHGCTDASAIVGTKQAVVLLDVGAQSVTGPELSPANPGVTLTQTSTPSPVRLTYRDLVTVLESYLGAFARCSQGTPATIAIGTNNDGAWDQNGSDYYSAEERGSDWAGSVLNMLGSETGITLMGANDIEAGFASTQVQAQAWEDSYLAAAITDRDHLIYNGSADACPDGFGDIGQACAPGWTQQGIYDLAYNGGQVSVLPEIYGPSDAAKWANIDQTGGSALDFAGVLTQHELDPSTYTPASGWSALTDAIGTLQSDPAIPAVSDIRNG
ncbi:MAG TPA: hypothetical protein VGH43_00905 [Jatrophihabitans sp.]|jgi:hypothetical protein